MITRPSQILRDLAGRDDLGAWLTRHGYTGTGVEVGTHTGTFAEQILSAWDGTLCCVDPWCKWPDSVYHDTSNEFDQEAIFSEAKERLTKYGKRCRLIRATSEAAAIYAFADESLDFAYIDANHKYESVTQDIELWWPKVRSGGLIGGHDFYYRLDSGCDINALDAVLDFSLATGLRPHATNCHSWWFLKT